MASVLITGSALRIGRTIALHSAKRGYDVVIHCHKSVEAAYALAHELADQFPNQRFVVVPVDLMHPEAPHNLMEQAIAAFGSVDILINNASIFHYDQLHDLTTEKLDAHMWMNATVPLLLSKGFAAQSPQVERQIINIIDQRVLNLTPHFLSYTLSKSSLWTQTQMLARALAPDIRVNAIAPGFTLPAQQQTQEQFDAACAKSPLQTATPLNDFGVGLDFLMSAKSVTGQILALDSGQHMGWENSSRMYPRFVK
jgi:NAD(P)-dependent dehydrogenase (short-subunit alcohol dehydrogenase family)